jgi:hypothetical protein
VLIDFCTQGRSFVGESTFPGRLFKVSLGGEVLGVIGTSGSNLKQFSPGAIGTPGCLSTATPPLYVSF